MRKRNLILFTGTLIIFVFIATLSLAQDKIILKNGEVMTGKIVKSDNKGITVEIMEGKATLTIPPEKILEVKIQKPGLFKTAQEYYIRGEYDLAFEAYKIIAQRYGGYSWGQEAFLIAAQCLMKMNNYSELTKWYQNFLDDFPQSKIAPQVELNLADIYLTEEDYLRAMQTYERLVKDRKGEPVAKGYYGMGDCYFQQKKFEEALVCYLKIAVLYYEFRDEVANALLKSAECYQALDDNKRMMETYREVIKEFPGTEYAKRANEALMSLKEAER